MLALPNGSVSPARSNWPSSQAGLPSAVAAAFWRVCAVDVAQVRRPATRASSRVRAIWRRQRPSTTGTAISAIRPASSTAPPIVSAVSLPSPNRIASGQPIAGMSRPATAPRSVQMPPLLQRLGRDGQPARPGSRSSTLGAARVSGGVSKNGRLCTPATPREDAAREDLHGVVEIADGGIVEAARRRDLRLRSRPSRAAPRSPSHRT